MTHCLSQLVHPERLAASASCSIHPRARVRTAADYHHPAPIRSVELAQVALQQLVWQPLDGWSNRRSRLLQAARQCRVPSAAGAAAAAGRGLCGVWALGLGGRRGELRIHTTVHHVPSSARKASRSARVQRELSLQAALWRSEAIHRPRQHCQARNSDDQGSRLSLDVWIKRRTAAATAWRALIAPIGC